MHLSRFLTGLLIFLPFLVFCQEGKRTVPTSNLRKISVDVLENCLLVSDSFSILPSSVEVTADSVISPSAVIIRNNKIFLQPNLCASFLGKKISVTYRVFPFDFETPYFGLDTSLLTKKDVAIQGAYGSIFTPSAQNIIDSEGLQYRGSFGRGLSVGNNQSFVLNSNFDLQLQGDIGNDIKVIAAISDENLPIQAQGNTQQLQEFDRVFIQLSKGKSSLIAGDYELRNGNSHFMSYYKKLKGLSANTFYDINKNIAGRSRAGFAVSRGKFARQILLNQEGNQGPYKLQGNNNERFIIVLSGTEKVYFNGILLKRGFDLDYVIDYNRAEITFSPTRVVARDSRIIIEFEYTDVNYVRTLYEANQTLKGKTWEWNFNFYSEQDSKANTGNALLDTSDIRILEESGDDRNKMVRSSIRLLDTSSTEVDLIRYKFVPNPFVPGENILIFTSNLDSARYTAVFSEVGDGKGDYEIDNNANVNGRVYRYVGKNMGKYAPVVQLIPPEQKQLMTTGGFWQINPKFRVFGEAALSNYDINTRSVIDNENNTGIAYTGGLSYQTRLDSAGQWNLTTRASYENVQAGFQPLNPFRNAEFQRDWNIPITPEQTQEHLLGGSVTLQQKKGFLLEYGFRYFDREGLYQGSKHLGKMEWSRTYFMFAGNVSYLKSDNRGNNQTTDFLRPNLKLNIHLDKKKNWSIMSELDAEQNIITNKSTGNLTGSASYQHYKVYFGNNPEKNTVLRVGFNRRYDQLPEVDTIRQAAVADEWEINGKWSTEKGNLFSVNVTHRDLMVLENQLLPTVKSTKTLIGKIENQLVFFNKALKTNSVYAVTSGQEPKIEYKFVKLETGRGEFVYIGNDENPNLSLVQDFRYNPSDPLANYIRISLYNNEFIRTNNVELNQSVRLDLDKIFVVKKEFTKRKKKMYTFFSKFAALSNSRIQKRINESGISTAASYVNFSRQDSGLVAYTGLWNHTLFFNRGDVRFDIQLGNRRNDTRIVQLSGYEDRGKNDYFVRSRIRLAEKIDFILNAEQGKSIYASKIFNTRDYDIVFYNIFPEINYRPNQNSRCIAQYTYTNRRQTIMGMETATQNKFTLEYNWRKASLFNIDVQINYINILFSGEANSPIEYDMLEGLKNGNNFVWNLGFTRRMAKSIDLIITYEGRKPGINPTIHVGQAQVKATF